MRSLRQLITSLPPLVAACALVSAPLFAAAAPAVRPAPGLSIVRASDYVPRGGHVDVSAIVTLAEPVREMSVRFRVLSTGGTLIYQHTATLERLPAGDAVVRFDRPASALGLKEGAYRLDVRAQATGMEAASVSETLLLVDDRRAPVTVAVMVRVRGTPLIGPTGAPTSDPATATAARDQATAAADIRRVRPDIPFTLAVAPVLLDDWRRIAQGYELPGTPGEVSLEATVPSAYRDASRAMADAAEAGLQFAGLPYAEPDLAGLEAAGALDDLATHVTLASRVTSSTLHTATVGTVLDGARVPSSAVRLLADRGVRWAVTSAGSVPLSGAATPTPGVHRIEGASPVLLVYDAQASSLLSRRSSARTDFLAYLLKHAASKKERGQPVVAVVEVGEGATTAVSDVQAALAALARVRWVRMVTLAEAAAMRPADTLVLADAPPSMDASAAAYWQTVAEARGPALALRAATEPKDPDGSACERAIMLAEGRMLSGSGRESGAAFASQARELATSILGKVSLTTPDVTLSGASGKVRTSISNGSGKVLTLAVTAEPQDMRVVGEPRTELTAPPGESIITVPVQVRSSLKGHLRLSLTAGTMELAATESTVSAGYMDRLAVVGLVVLVLLGLLWYIRSRGRQAVAQIREAASKVPRVGRSKDAS